MIGNAFSNNYIEYKSNGDGTKILSIKEYLEEINPCLKVIINNLRKSNTKQIQLTIAMNIMSPRRKTCNVFQVW